MELCQEVNTIPLCNTCGHHHESGVTCPICGHAGKAQIFTKMRRKAKMSRDTRYEVFNGNTVLASLIGSATACKVSALNATVLELIEDFRDFEAGHDNQSLSDTQDPVDLQSAHMLCLQGDAIIASGRFQLLPFSSTAGGSSSSSCKLQIDQVYTHNQHYRSHYAYTLLEKILTLVQQLIVHNQHGVALRCLSVCVDHAALRTLHWLDARLTALGFQKEPPSNLHVTTYNVELENASTNHSLPQIIDYIQARKKNTSTG